MDTSRKREFTNAAKIIVGGISAAVAYELVNRAIAPASNIPELVILGAAAVVALVVLTFVTWVYFILLEDDTPTPEVDLSEDALDDIAHRLSEKEMDDG